MHTIRICAYKRQIKNHKWHDAPPQRITSIQYFQVEKRTSTPSPNNWKQMLDKIKTALHTKYVGRILVILLPAYSINPDSIRIKNPARTANIATLKSQALNTIRAVSATGESER